MQNILGQKRLVKTPYLPKAEDPASQGTQRRPVREAEAIEIANDVRCVPTGYLLTRDMGRGAPHRRAPWLGRLCGGNQVNLQTPKLLSLSYPG